MLRRGVGAVIVGVGTEVVLRETAAILARFDPVVTNALEGGLVAAAATALGSLPVVLPRRISRRASSMMLGFGAGLMLAASSFSLIIPALSLTREG